MKDRLDKLTKLRPDLYGITDRGLARQDDEAQVQAMLAGGARLIQLRDKSSKKADLIPVAKRCKELCREAGALLIINDFVEVVAMIGADGVHLGQDDILPKEARTMLGEDFLIGISTHNQEQFDRALGEPVDYIALGPIYGTTTKANPDPPVGLETVRYAVEKLENDKRPLVLIGGINHSNLNELLAIAPKALFAVMGAVLSSENISQSVRSFRQALRGNFGSMDTQDLQRKPTVD